MPWLRQSYLNNIVPIQSQTKGQGDKYNLCIFQPWYTIFTEQTTCSYQLFADEGGLCMYTCFHSLIAELDFGLGSNNLAGFALSLQVPIGFLQQFRFVSFQ